MPTGISTERWKALIIIWRQVLIKHQTQTRIHPEHFLGCDIILGFVNEFLLLDYIRCQQFQFIATLVVGFICIWEQYWSVMGETVLYVCILKPVPCHVYPL